MRRKNNNLQFKKNKDKNYIFKSSDMIIEKKTFNRILKTFKINIIENIKESTYFLESIWDEVITKTSHLDRKES